MLEIILNYVSFVGLVILKRIMCKKLQYIIHSMVNDHHFVYNFLRLFLKFFEVVHGCTLFRFGLFVVL
jgi:hypothetical protein